MERLRWLALALYGVVVTTGNAGAQGLSIPGSGAPEVVLRELATAYNQHVRAQQVTIPPSTGTAGGIRAVEQGDATLGRIARTLTDEEAARGLRGYPIARDAVVFVVGADVTLKTITPRQLADIYAGRVESWSGVGGGARQVRLITREPSDTALVTIRAVLPDFKKLEFPVTAKQVNRDAEALKLVESYHSSIAFFTQASLHAANGTLRALELDGVAPTAANLASGRYPIAATYTLIAKGRLASEAARFVEFVHSSQGRAVLERLRVLPLPPS